MKISFFFDTDYLDSASYDNIRKIACYADGFKNSGRKAMWTALKKNVTKGVKVSRFASTISEYTEYLHAEDALQNVIMYMPKRYIGTNNLPLMTEEGNFGKRFKNESSAPRYVFTALEHYTPKIFMKEDFETLEGQVFEGHVIEPRYLVPILPTILINGSTGAISTGFTQDILARPLKDMITSTVNYIKTGKVKIPNPGWNGFKGSVVPDPKIYGRWLIRGKYETINTFGLKITELPAGYQLTEYVKILAELEDNKVITSFEDKSENEEFHFIVRVPRKFFEMTEDQIFETLKLELPFTEKYNCIGLENNIIEFKSPEEVFIEYAKLREKHYELRKLEMIDSITQKLKELASMYIFVNGIINDTIDVKNRKKDFIVSQLEANDRIVSRDGNYNYLLNMSIYSLTEEKLLALKDEIANEKNLLEYYKSSSEKDLWLADIEALTKKS